MKLILLEASLTISTEWEDTYKMVISASMGQIRFDEIKSWLEANTTPL